MSIFEFLSKLNIHYTRVDHPPVFTCEEGRALVPPISGITSKNLFLRDKKGRQHFLVSVPEDKKVDLSGLGNILSVQGLSFASAERLRNLLQLEPGSVSLLGVINDPEHQVKIVIDQKLWESEAILCHPLVNTSTLSISIPDFKRIFEATGHQVKVIYVPGITL